MLSKETNKLKNNMLKKQGIDTGKINQMSYKVDSPAQWFNAEDFLKYCSNNKIPQLERLLLVSDGLLTRLLKALFLSEVSFQVSNQEIVPIDKEMADYLETTPNQNAISREVWMGNKKQNKLVYAYSSILTEQINPDLYKEIVYKNNPLGSLISEHKLPVLRNKFFIGQIKSEQIASNFGIDTNQQFWARIYRITAKKELTIAIFEVFSPEIANVFKD
jgi:chorismate-pyruvate lyase